MNKVFFFFIFKPIVTDRQNSWWLISESDRIVTPTSNVPDIKLIMGDSRNKLTQQNRLIKVYSKLNMPVHVHYFQVYLLFQMFIHGMLNGENNNTH